MKLKVKKLVESAVIPSRAKQDDAGYDLTAISKNEINQKEFGYIEYGFGLALEIEPGYVGLIFPRSSISRTDLILSNAVGVVDPGYRGEVTARFKWVPRTKTYEIGDRIAQLIIIKTEELEIEVTDNLSDSDRGSGGYGSSGS